MITTLWKPTSYQFVHPDNELKFRIELDVGKFYWSISKEFAHYSEDCASGVNSTLKQALANLEDYCLINQIANPPKYEDFEIFEYRTEIEKYSSTIALQEENNTYQVIISGGILSKKSDLITKSIFLDLEKAKSAALEMIKLFQWMETNLTR